MSRPDPRPSKLAGQSPIQPQPQAEAEEKKEWPKKTSFYQTASDADRLRGAFLATVAEDDGHRTMTDLINYAVEREIQRLQDVHNNGEPFKPVGAGRGLRGRPPE